MDDASKIQEDLAQLRQQFAPPGMQPAGESPKESLPVSAPPATSFTKPMGARMSEPVSAGRREAPRVTGPAETAAMMPSVPDVAIPQELRDVGVETAPPDTITIHDDISLTLKQNPASIPVQSPQQTKLQVLPERGVVIAGVPPRFANLLKMEPEEAMKNIKAIIKAKGVKSSASYEAALIGRQIKKNIAKLTGLEAGDNEKEIYGQ